MAPGHTGEAEGFVPPKGGDKCVSNGEGSGWLAADGGVLFRLARARPRTTTRTGTCRKGDYTNVYPGGKSR
ncbi:hypothetical protein [Nocardia sp. NBC_00508]|uniref:hypothetical protein n=1 Tax=Nocardia sp. NBC_00508 TaxID=2975992 RepID=UPI003FA5EECD